MGHTTHCIIASILSAVFCSNCTCYRSFVDADFHEHNSDSRIDKDFTASWKQGDGFHNSINPLVMIDTRTSAGEVQIYSHQDLGTYSHLVFESVELTNRSGNTVASNLPTMPLSIRYQEIKSSRYVERDEWIYYQKDLAKVMFRPEVSISGSPYTIKIDGYYMKKNRVKKPLHLSIRMDLSRDRRFENIANCWP